MVKPKFVTISEDNKLVFAKLGDKLLTLKDEIVHDAEENDEVLSYYLDTLGLIKREDGEYSE